VQRYLKEILAKPPYNLGNIANVLLVVSAILLASIFLIKEEDRDITLNLAQKQVEVEIPGEIQMAQKGFTKLRPIIKLGQSISRGDTLFIALDEIQENQLQQLRSKLNDNRLTPTEETLNYDFVDERMRTKMIALARAKTVTNKGRDNVDYTSRLKVLNRLIKDNKQELQALNASIPKFKAIEKDLEKRFFELRNRYEKDVSLLPALKKMREKLTASELNTKQRMGQAKTTRLKIREFESEVKFIRNAQSKSRSKSATEKDFIVYEADLAMALDSLWENSLVLSTISGQVASFGNLENVMAQDTLIMLESVNEGVNRSNVIFATANDKDGAKIYPGANLLILIQDGTSVNGEIVKNIKSKESSTYQVEIASAEELSFLEIEQIIVPSKNEQFIEKVLENF